MRNPHSHPVTDANDGLDRDDAVAIDMARQAVGQALEAWAPQGDRLALAAVVVCRLFADFLSQAAHLPALKRDLVAVMLT